MEDKKNKLDAIERIVDKMLWVAAIIALVILVVSEVILPAKYVSGAELDGKTIYNQYCAFCHKTDGKGGIMGASDLTKTNLPEKEIKEVIKNGKGKMMPSFKSTLKDEQIEKLVKYIQDFKK